MAAWRRGGVAAWRVIAEQRDTWRAIVNHADVLFWGSRGDAATQDKIPLPRDRGVPPLPPNTIRVLVHNRAPTSWLRTLPAPKRLAEAPDANR